MTQMRVNPAACSGHGLCAELLPELITLDEWGYPLLRDAELARGDTVRPGDTPDPDGPGPSAVPAALMRQARRAVRDCPALALVLTEPGDRR
jgi:ferredoxin